MMFIRRIEENDQTDETGVCGTGRGGGPGPIRERWADLRELVAGFRRGTMIRVLACQFSMSESSVTRFCCGTDGALPSWGRP